MKILGYIAAIAFAVMAVPQIIYVIETGDSNGTTWSFIILNYIGNICSFIYVLWTNIKNKYFQLPLFLNYSIATINLIILTVLKVYF